jgi:hypothetical protein
VVWAVTISRDNESCQQSNSARYRLLDGSKSYQDNQGGRFFYGPSDIDTGGYQEFVSVFQLERRATAVEILNP